MFSDILNFTPLFLPSTLVPENLLSWLCSRGSSSFDFAPKNCPPEFTRYLSGGCGGTPKNFPSGDRLASKKNPVIRDSADKAEGRRRHSCRESPGPNTQRQPVTLCGQNKMPCQSVANNLLLTSDSCLLTLCLFVANSSAISAVKNRLSFSHFFPKTYLFFSVFRNFSLFFSIFCVFSLFFSIFSLPILPNRYNPTPKTSFFTQKPVSPHKKTSQSPPFLKFPDNLSLIIIADILRHKPFDFPNYFAVVLRLGNI